MSPRQPLSLGEQGLYALCVLCVYMQARLWGETSVSAVGHAEGKRGHIASVPRHTSACVRGSSPPIDTDNMRLSARCVHYRV